MVPSTSASRKRLFSLVALLPLWLAFTTLASVPSAGASLIASESGVRAQDPSRKSISWGPNLDQLFVVPSVASESALDRRSSVKSAHVAAIHAVNAEEGPKDPRSVAERLAKHILGLNDRVRPASSAVDFYIRPDSYTDRQSGISHYYVRQLVNGLEVSDGDLNINIGPDGSVLSFGSSLYTGQVPAPFTNPAFAADAGAKAKSSAEVEARCQQLRAQIGDLLYPDSPEAAAADEPEPFIRGGAHQYVFSAMESKPVQVRPPRKADVKEKDILFLQEELHELCSVPSDDPLLQGANLGSRMTGSMSSHWVKRGVHGGPESILDPRLALVYFLQQATPDDGLAAKLSNPNVAETEASQIFSTFEHKLQPHHGKTASGKQPAHAQVEYLHNVPSAKGPVPAQLSYVQTENGELNLVWKFEIPLEDNAYETYVDASRPGSITTVLDWVHSMPRTRKMPELGRPDFTGYGRKPSTAEEDEEPAEPPKEDKPAPGKLGHDPIYKVFKWGLNDPTEGVRTYEKGNRYDEASPAGWHTVPGRRSPFEADSTDDTRVVQGNGTYYTDTRGNNVFAQADLSGNGDWRTGTLHRPKGKADSARGSDMTFDYPFPWRKAEKKHKELSPEKYIAAAVVQLFVTINEYHDLLYAYGFDETSGNFQEHNFGRGGEDGDGVIAFAQDGAGTDNADFMTPPDGQRGRMRMYVWDQSTPFRDGDFEAGIVIHEYSHGLSTRLTGGPANSGCLGWGEAGGMGEGWGDALASIIRRTGPKPHDWPMGSWASNRVKGIRNYPYSTNMTVNPETYSYLDHAGYWGVHAIGEVWATILNEVEEKLVAKHGFTNSLFPPGVEAPKEEQDVFFLTTEELGSFAHKKTSQRRVPRHGNSLLVQLILDGMKLQPCRPSFFDARDAIIQADKHLTGGQNKCLLWEAFAKRGLGTDAQVIGRTPWGGGKRTDGYSVPRDCKASK